MNTFNNQTHFADVTPHDCQIIANAINQENEEKPHMLPLDADQLYSDAINNGYLILKETQSGVLIAFVKFMVAKEIPYKPDDTMYEWGSAVTLPEYRNKWYGSKIVGKLLTDFRERSLFCVTNESKIIHLSLKNNQREIFRENMTPEFQKIVDGPQEPCEGDRVFGNDALFSKHQVCK